MAEVAGAGPERWIEELPHDVEPIGDQGSLRGRLSDGSRVVARTVAVPSGEEARLLVEHLRRVARLADPHLVPVRGAVVEGDAVWVISDLDGGVPLDELLRSRPPSPPLAAAIGIDVLAGLAALQRAGLAHGALHAGNVHLGRDGRSRLGDYALRPRFRPGAERLGWGDPRNDVMAAGILLCAALGIPPAPDGQALRDAERTMPALVATARALAAGRGGRNASGALGAVRAAAGRLADPGLRRRELGGLVGAVAPAAGTVPAAPVLDAARPWSGVPPPPDPGPPLPPEPTPPGPPPPEPPPPPGPAPRPQPLPRPPASGPFPPPPAAPLAPGPWSEPAGRPAAARRPPLSGARLAGGVAVAVILAVAVSALAATLMRSAASRPAASPGGAAAAATAAPSNAATPTPQPTAADDEPGAASPDAAVSTFYQLVVQHDFDQAVQLWSARMREAYPPDENINQRFADTTSLRLRRHEVSSTGDGTAVVSVDLLEVRDGQTYHWVGSWYLVQQSSGWLLDQPALRPAG